MRPCICVAIVMGSVSPALASPEGDVEALLRTTIDHVTEASSTAGFVKGAIVIGAHANVFDLDSGKLTTGESGETPDFTSHGKLWPMLFGKASTSGARQLGKVTTVVDAAAHTAWFIAPLEVSGKRTMHVSGVAVVQGNKWLLRVLDIQLAIPDGELAKHPVLAPRVAQTPATPTTKLGKAIVGWFKERSLAKHAAAGVVLAGGSAPQELSSGADAIKFVATLDHIDLIPIALEAADPAAVAVGTAFLPISKEERDGVIQFGFRIYAVQENGDWKWKSIQFADDQVPARD